jgi:pilus assembly protein CpaC
MKHLTWMLLSSVALVTASMPAAAQPDKSEAQSAAAAKMDHRLEAKTLAVPVNRSALVSFPSEMAEVAVANPDIADVHASGPNHLTVVGKKLGQTNLRVFDKTGALIREIDVQVGHDLPAIRRALKNFLPDEAIGVEMVNTSIALTGRVRSAESAEKAIKIVKDFMHSASDRGAAAAESAQSLIDNGDSDILNMMQVTSGQQVMLKVRVGEINREALKNLGIDLSAVGIVDGVNTIALGTGGGIGSLVAPASSSEPTILPGQFLLPGGRTPTNTRGIFSGVWRPGAGTFGGLVKALERDGLFKLLAEPNLVAVSGEQAEFLAGGEIPVPVVQGGSSSNNISVEYKPFGVAVRFTPFVLSENRVRMAVQPEVSEISTENAIRISGFDIPSISTRRAKTTIELAPGESFMIAGLIKDQMRATIDQVPGAKELPVLGALFRSNEFRRNETELVIAVTPYLVDPVRNDDIKLPTDNFRPANQMDMFFYGKLGGIDRAASAPSAGPEGPVGYMVD